MLQSDSIATIPAQLASNVTELAERPALHVHRDGEYRAIHWAELGRDVRRLAAALASLGVVAGARVATVAENRYEWIVADLAILLARAAHVPVHASLSGAQMAYQIADSGAMVTIIAGREQADKLAPHAAELCPRTQFFAFDPWDEAASHPLGAGPLAEVTGRVSDGDSQVLEAQSLERISPGDLATIMYTSGTTGRAKGVMLSHGNLASNAFATAEAFPLEPDECRLCFLPLTHVYARTCDLYTWIYRGSEFALARSRETILADCAQIHPTMVNGVPYFYEKLCRHLGQAGQTDQPGVLAELLGGRVRYCFSGGAALPLHVAEIFDRQGLLLLQGYGLSEASPVVTASTPAEHKIGTVGRPIADVEVKIAEDGEILTRGPHVMLGYWQDPAATSEVIRDGWLSTGDLGRLDDDGYLMITGRKKEILVTATGKNIAPVYLESLLSASPLIAQAMVVGDGRNYLSALIVPDPEHLAREIAAKKISVSSRSEALSHPAVQELYRKEIDRLLSGVAEYEQIGRFTLLDRGFSLDEGELTVKASLRRDVIGEHFADAIAKMYL